MFDKSYTHFFSYRIIFGTKKSETYITFKYLFSVFRHVCNLWFIFCSTITSFLLSKSFKSYKYEIRTTFSCQKL